MNANTAVNLHPASDTTSEQLFDARLETLIEEKIEAKLIEREAAHTPRMSIIATKGTMDMAYPPFILASTAAALGWEVSIFFTFYGLELLKQDLDLKVSPLGNPAMPMKLPFGPEWLQSAKLSVPNIALASIPGFEKAATSMMSKTLKNKGIASIAELRELSIEAEVKMVGCQMTAELYGMDKDEFIPEISEWVGAASFLPFAQKSDVTLFV